MEHMVVVSHRGRLVPFPRVIQFFQAVLVPLVQIGSGRGVPAAFLDRELGMVQQVVADMGLLEVGMVQDVLSPVLGKVLDVQLLMSGMEDLVVLECVMDMDSVLLPLGMDLAVLELGMGIVPAMGREPFAH